MNPEISHLNNHEVTKKMKDEAYHDVVHHLHAEIDKLKLRVQILEYKFNDGEI